MVDTHQTRYVSALRLSQLGLQQPSGRVRSLGGLRLAKDRPQCMISTDQQLVDG
jgi:hypothetical protein